MNELYVEQILLDGSIQYKFTPVNVCSRLMFITVNKDNVLVEVEIIGGCDGNRKAVARLVQGLTLQQVIDKVRGITCGNKSTSCADQLAVACEMILEIKMV